MQRANKQYIRHDSTIELLVRGDVATAATLSRIEQARAEAGERETVRTVAGGETRTTDVLETMRDVAAENDSFAAAFESADTTGNGVPDRNVESLYDRLYEVAPGEATAVLHREDGEYVATRMAITVAPDAAGDAVTHDGSAVAGTLAGEGVTVAATGEPIIQHVVQDELVETLLMSLFLMLGAVLVVLMAVSRLNHGSAALGAITVLPVGLAVAWIIGTMSLLGYPLSVLNIIIASLTIGIGVDYSIHVTERFQEEFAEATPVETAVTRTLRGTGGALLGSAATTAIGFGVLALAIHPALQQFGVITAIMIGYAFVAAVFVLPSLLVLWARLSADRPLSSLTARTKQRIEGFSEE